MSYLGEDIAKLGFGLMRLPKIGEGENKHSDVAETSKMVDAFLEAGFTYFDTAWAYGDSEDTTRQALVERYPRESFQLASKNAAWLRCKTREDAIAQLDTSLERTGAGYFDFYLLHNLGQARTRVFDDFDMWTFAQEQKAAGKIRHVGFSFHSTAEELEEILVAHPEAEFVQLQINWADWDNPAVQSRACYEVARKYGKPVIIMEPIKGGNLANLPESVKAVFEEADPDASTASWAMRFAADLPGIITVLSGMSSLEQMEDNIATLSSFTRLSQTERDTFDRAREEMGKFPTIPCTTCKYCEKVCPMDIGISGTFDAANVAILYDNIPFAKNQMGFAVEGQGLKPASACIECGSCAAACPQRIDVVGQLKRCVDLLDIK